MPIIETKEGLHLRCDGVFVGELCDEEERFTVAEIEEEGTFPNGWIEVYDLGSWRCLCAVCDENENPYPFGGSFEEKVDWHVRDLQRKSGPDASYLDQDEAAVLRVNALWLRGRSDERSALIAVAMHRWWKQNQLSLSEARA